MIHDDINDKDIIQAPAINTTGGQLTAKEQYEKQDNVPGQGGKIQPEIKPINKPDLKYVENEYKVKHIRSIMEDIKPDEIKKDDKSNDIDIEVKEKKRELQAEIEQKQAKRLMSYNDKYGVYVNKDKRNIYYKDKRKVKKNKNKTHYVIKDEGKVLKIPIAEIESLYV